MYFKQPIKITPKTLSKFIDLIYQGRMDLFAHDIAYNPDTVRRWCSGRIPISKPDELREHMIRLARYYGQRNFDIEKELGE